MIDQFGEKFSMKLNGGNERVQTYMGSLCSLALLFVVTAYAYHKFDMYLSNSAVEIVTSVQHSHFEQDFVFDYEQGMNFAFGFTAYD